MGTKITSVCARRLKALGVWAIVGIAIFFVVDRVLWWIKLKDVKMLPYAINVAILVSAISAVAVSIWHGWLMRRHARLSLKPHLDFSWNDIKSHELVLYNGGAGAAIVTQVYVAAGDDPLKPATSRQWDNVRQKVGFAPFEEVIFLGDTVIPPNSSVPLIKIICSRNITVLEREQEDTCQDKLRLKVDYKSAAYKEPFFMPIITLGKIPEDDTTGT